MALPGDEKRIQALFSELSLQDQNSAPAFEKLWREAQHSALHAPAHHFNTAAAVITFATALLITAGTLAVWLWSTRNPNPSPQNVANAAPTTAPLFATPAPRESNNSPTTKDHPRSQPRRKQSSERPRSKEPITTDAQILSHWQSPTTILMGSPSNIVWNSLPQLNESAAALKQFLPKKNEATKESNQ